MKNPYLGPMRPVRCSLNLEQRPQGGISMGRKDSCRKEEYADPVTPFVDSSEAAFASLLFYPVVGHGIGALAGPPWSC